MTKHCNDHPEYNDGCLNCDYARLRSISLITDDNNCSDLTCIMRKNIKGKNVIIKKENYWKKPKLDKLEEILNSREGVVIIGDCSYFTDDFKILFKKLLDILGGFEPNTTKYTIAINKSTISYYSVSQELKLLDSISNSLCRLKCKFPLNSYPENEIRDLLFPPK